VGPEGRGACFRLVAGPETCTAPGFGAKLSRRLLAPDDPNDFEVEGLGGVADGELVASSVGPSTATTEKFRVGPEGRGACFRFVSGPETSITLGVVSINVFDVVIISFGPSTGSTENFWVALSTSGGKPLA
jgi:hypothetical protein